MLENGQLVDDPGGMAVKPVKLLKVMRLQDPGFWLNSRVELNEYRDEIGGGFWSQYTQNGFKNSK
jgi:hypothetical protein